MTARKPSLVRDVSACVDRAFDRLEAKIMGIMSARSTLTETRRRPRRQSRKAPR